MTKSPIKSVNVIDMTHTLDRNNLRPNAPNYIVLHSTRSYPEFEHLYDNHKRRGFSGVGYHFFVSASKFVKRNNL